MRPRARIRTAARSSEQLAVCELRCPDIAGLGDGDRVREETLPMKLATRDDGIRDGALCLVGLRGDAICPVTYGACESSGRGNYAWGLEVEPEILLGTIWDGGTVLLRALAFGSIEQEARPS
jgi:hypothetical protein